MISGHHFTNGQRVRGEPLTLVRAFVKDYPNKYSYDGRALVTVYFALFVTDDGRKVWYMGCSRWWDGFNRMPSCTFTVQHVTHRGRQETRIKRPRVQTSDPKINMD